MCFYADPEVEDRIIVYPSVISKIDYVTSSLKEIGRKVTIVSVAPSVKGKFNGYEKTVDDKESHIYFKSNHTNNALIDKFNFILQNLRILAFLIKNAIRSDTVIVYHSLYNRFWLKLYNKFFAHNLILQIEDVFSALSEKNRKFANTEWRLFRSMKKCICVNDILREDLFDVGRTMLSYGSYNTPPIFEKENYEKCRLVYAGVIEQERKAAFLAVEAMKYLSDKYELHILGFGNDNDISALSDVIENINSSKKCECVQFHGRMQGEEYFKFLQSCDIALSTHAYDETSMLSADYTFPSKIIVYLSNNLKVVAQRLKVLEKSEVAQFLSFYDRPEPELIADAIESTNVSDDFNSIGLIVQLDKHFKEELSKMLEE